MANLHVEKACGVCVPVCAKMDPVCKPIEKGLFCGLLQCLEDGRPFVLMFGAFCGGCQFADVIAEDYRPPDQPMSKMNELVLDTVTALFYILGSYSVYNKDKQFTNPVMRFGLLLILFRIIDYFFISGAFRLPVNEGRYVDQWCQAQLAPGSCEARLENKPGDIHDLSVDPLATCHFPCRWVCMGDDGQPADCEDEELSATLADGRTIQIKQDHGQCMPFQVDGHDMTIAECVNSGNWYDADFLLFPQCAAQMFYCWLLNAYVQKKENSLLGEAAEAKAPEPEPSEAPV